jgi:hypothetical protein
MAGSGEAARVGALSFNTLSGLTCCHLYAVVSTDSRSFDLGNNWLRDRIPDAVTNCSNLRILGLRRYLI